MTLVYSGSRHQLADELCGSGRRGRAAGDGGGAAAQAGAARLPRAAARLTSACPYPVSALPPTLQHEQPAGPRAPVQVRCAGGAGSQRCLRRLPLPCLCRSAAACSARSTPARLPLDSRHPSCRPLQGPRRVLRNPHPPHRGAGAPAACGSGGSLLLLLQPAATCRRDDSPALLPPQTIKLRRALPLAVKEAFDVGACRAGGHRGSHRAGALAARREAGSSPLTAAPDLAPPRTPACCPAPPCRQRWCAACRAWWTAALRTWPSSLTGSAMRGTTGCGGGLLSAAAMGSRVGHPPVGMPAALSSLCSRPLNANPHPHRRRATAASSQRLRSPACRLTLPIPAPHPRRRRATTASSWSRCRTAGCAAWRCSTPTTACSCPAPRASPCRHGRSMGGLRAAAQGSPGGRLRSGHRGSARSPLRHRRGASPPAAPRLTHATARAWTWW